MRIIYGLLGGLVVGLIGLSAGCATTSDFSYQSVSPYTDNPVLPGHPGILPDADNPDEVWY